MNFRYPIFLDLTRKRCLVTGEGFEIAGKVRGLVDAGGDVVYVHPSIVPEIRALVDQELITWHARDFQPQDLDGCFLVITCGSHNAQIFALAEIRGILCNAVDDPKHCRYIYGSKVTRGELSIAISTNGTAPALAVRIKERLQAEIGPEYAAFLKIMREFRPQITASIKDFHRRRELWYQLVDSEILHLLKAGDPESAHRLARQLIEEAVAC
jgi:siroheme synthase-like protein